MSIYKFVLRQYDAINQGGWAVFWRKVKHALSFCFLPPWVPFVVVMRLLRPWILIRVNPLINSRIGHFAANTELYLCERDAGINVPKRRHVDLCYHSDSITSNRQLAIMWGRNLRIWPAWLLGPTYRLNRLFPGGSIHEVENTQRDRDVHNLLESTPPHLCFTLEEELRGRAALIAMGIPDGSDFVCLNVRDNSYLETVFRDNNDNHNYRDCDVQNFVLAAEALADLGYYVIRMGAVVKASFNSNHPRVIDYAVNGMRSDFMDIYLGEKCKYFIGVGEGLCAVPMVFRRPIAYVNMVPIGCVSTFLKDTVFICKKHWLRSEQRWLSLKEVFSLGVGFCLRSSDYEAKGVEVVENTPEEIRALAIEMLERLNGTWQTGTDDDALQRRFWEIYPVDACDVFRNRPLHGKVRARYGAQFLRDNRWWLE